MGSFGALYTLEAQRLFRRPLAWLVLCLGAGMMALFYLLLMVRYLDQESSLRAAGVTAELLVRYFGSAALIVLLLTPLMTMQAVANDKRDGMLRFLFSHSNRDSFKFYRKSSTKAATGFYIIHFH